MDSLPFFLLIIVAFCLSKMNCKMMQLPNTVADSGYKPSMNGTHFDEQQDTQWSKNEKKIANYVGYKYKPLMDANQLDEQAIALWTDPQQQQQQTGPQSQSAVLHLDGATFKKTVLNPGKQVDYLVIFYSHTCPHCQSLAPELLAFAESVISQRDRAVVAVYNVNRPFNALYARQIKTYPTVIFFPKEATQFRDGRRVDGFGEMPREQMEAVFGQLLAGKFDLSESQDQLLELDASSFQPTIDSATGRPQPLAFFVGFFNGKASDAWKTLARQAHRWRQVVRFAFVNCARNENRQNPCRQQMPAGGNGQRLPMAKLIMQNDAMPMPYREDAEFLRSQLAHKLFELSHANPRAIGRPLASNRFVSVKENHRSQFLGNFHDPFAPLLPILWPRVEHFLQVYLLMVIEHPTRNGNAEFASKLILALNHWHRFIHIVPIASTQPLVTRVFAGAGAGTFPHIRLYRTDLAGPILRESYGWKQKATSDLVAVNDVLRTTGLMEDDTKLYGGWMPQLECEKLFTRCRPLYFASETDMLKALREAVYDEVVTKHEHIRHKHRHHLLNFLYVLEQYLPDSTKTPRGMKPLPRMQAAKRVFADLRRLLDKNGHVSAQQWEAALVSSERKHGNPFPAAETDWRHCRGFLLKNSRRFTCGMWTAFHVVTVNAFKKKGDAKSTLRAIQGWVDSFFGCEDCRSHFMEMTTQAMPIQYEVKHRSDVVLYLWRAHNHVNERLALEETNVQEKIMQRDIVFKKRHFPPKFLCPGCWNPAQTLNFLIDYYERIEPTDSPSQSWELKMAREDEGWIYKDHLNYVF